MVRVRVTRYILQTDNCSLIGFFDYQLGKQGDYQTTRSKGA